MPGMNVLLRNARLNAIKTFAGDAGKVRFYNGTRPATGGTATTLLAELVCNATLAADASGGTLTLNAITDDASADTTGQATWCRWMKSDGTTHVMDLSVGTSGAEVNLNTVALVAGATVAITSAIITEGDA